MKKYFLYTLSLMFLVALSASCSGDGDSKDDKKEDGITAAKIRQNHAKMYDQVRDYLNKPELFKDGQWQKHYGDGNLWGPSFDILEYKLRGKKEHQDRALKALDENTKLVLEAAKDFANKTDDLENISMALLGIIEASVYLKDNEKYRKAADELIKSLDGASRLLGDYLYFKGGQFASSTYGPTSLSAFLALVHLEYVRAWPDKNKDYHLKRVREVIDATHKKAWSDDFKAYIFSPDKKVLWLYPNITMMAVYARAFEITKDSFYMLRFKETYKGIQPLKNKSGDHYHSPYSAVESGAKTDDYSTLSSQNYLIMGLWIFYKSTGEKAYLEEIDKILSFVSAKLHEKGVIYHHWVNNRRANDKDKYPYCLGCNAQTLFILAMIEKG